MSKSAETSEVRGIDWSVFDRLCAERGWDSDPKRAAGCGISYQHLRYLRTNSGKRRGQPGGKTIDQLVATFGSSAYPALITKYPLTNEDVA